MAETLEADKPLEHPGQVAADRKSHDVRPNDDSRHLSSPCVASIGVGRAR